MQEEQPPQAGIIDPARRGLLVASVTSVGLLVAGCGGRPSASSPSHVRSKPSSLEPGTTNPYQLDLLDLPNGAVHGYPWRYELDPQVPGYNHEAQVYTNTHATIHEGQLTIEAVKDTKARYESSRIDTKGRFAFTHGKLTTVAKLPKGVGTWPALWLLPDQSQTPAILAKYHIEDNPSSDYYYAWGGEIDLLETVGWENNPVNNTMTVHSHSSISTEKDEGISQLVQPVPDGEDAFHEYTLIKRPGLIEFQLDGKTIHGIERQHGDTLGDWGFDDFRYLVIANLALGGTWGGHMKQQFPPYGIDDSKLPFKFEINKLRYGASVA